MCVCLNVCAFWLYISEACEGFNECTFQVWGEFVVSHAVCDCVRSLIHIQGLSRVWPL